MRLSRFLRDTRGAAAAMTALFMVGAVGFMAIAIDLGHVFLVKCELQRAADAGAMAGALGLTTPSGTGVVRPAGTPNCGNAITAARNVVRANDADGAPLDPSDADIVFGTFDFATGTFTATGCGTPSSVKAVQVTTRRTVPLFFTGFMPGIGDHQDLTAQAISATGGGPSGGNTFPIAVDTDKVPPNNSVFKITLNPGTTDDGCWHSYKSPNTNASDLRDYVNGSLAPPPINIGDTIYVQNGVDASVLQEIQSQLAAHGGTWDVLVPIIPANAHTTTATVLGFAALEITEVSATGSDKYVQCRVVNNCVAPSLPPGGPDYGLGAGYRMVMAN